MERAHEAPPYLQVAHIPVCTARDSHPRQGMHRGLPAIVDEIMRSGSAEDIECMRYVLYEEAGTSAVRFPNGIRDCDEMGSPRPDRRGMRLADFVSHPNSIMAGLTEAHIAALRLYTTAAFRALNEPLRDRKRVDPHPFPVTIACIAEGIKRLRAVSAGAKSGDDVGRRKLRRGGTAKAETTELWRGLKDVTLDPEFELHGGTEFAPMSTTTSLSVALCYSASTNAAVLLRLLTTSFMQRGADLSYLSAFPDEAEVLFPPLTFLQVEASYEVDVGGQRWTVVDAVPHLGS